MSQSLVKNLVHLVYSTKNRLPWIPPEHRDGLFAYQAGIYREFSVSQSNVASVKHYIENQEEHHRKMTFQDELRELFRRHEMEFDERYVWD